MFDKKAISVFTALAVALLMVGGHAAHAASEYSPKEAHLLTISDGISAVLKDNRLVKIELASKDMSFDDTLIALSPLLPHISAGISKTYQKYVPEMLFGAVAVPMGDKNPLAGGFDIYQTLFDFGKSISQYQASTEVFHARKAGVEGIKRTITLEFIVSYFDILEAEKMILVAEKEVESLTSYLNDMQHLYDQGVIVENDLLPARVKLADAKQKLIASRNGREVAAAIVNTMLTLPLTQEIRARDPRSGTSDLPDLEGALRSAVSLRPEITFYDKQIRSCVLRERATAVRNLPTVFVDGGYQYTQNQYMVHENETYVKFGAKMDLYDGGATGAEIMKERDLHRKLQEQKNKLVDDIRFEVKRSYLGLKDAIEKLTVAKDVLGQAEENVRFYRVKYNNGAATSTDVLEAISLQTKAQTNYYSADYELKRSYTRLMYSMGLDLVSLYKETE